ncbi:MAG: Wadjet anti-phage system protein JetA family protein [Oceanospirillaceae bacterium]
MLFNKLPEDLFVPLSGKNRHVYQTVLIELADLFFDEDLIEPFIARDLVRSTIENTVVRIGLRIWEREEEDIEEDYQPPRSTAEYANRIYRRLVNTGWLEEEQQIYKSYVLMAPSNSYLLRSLVSIAKMEKRSYGGAVLNVLSSLEAAINDPDGRGITLQEAAQASSEFSAHLTDMLLGLRELKITLAQSQSPQEIVKQFFDTFVEQILVSDYKTLKTKNNPFRFRRQILSMLRDLQFDPLKLDKLIHHYQLQFENEYIDAESMVHTHINRIIRIFESVDKRLDSIDDFRYKLEKRVADTIRYMDKTTPGMASRLSRLIKQVANDEKLLQQQPITQLENVGFLSPSSIRSPIKRRIQVAPRVIHQQVIDPKVIELRELFKQYKERREVKIDRIEQYLARHFGKNTTLNANQFEINTIEDYICFSYIRHLASLGKQGKATNDRYKIEFKDQYIEVDNMVECRDFIISSTQQGNK